MKEKYIQFIGKYLKPWTDGSTGTPWTFKSFELVEFGNSNLPPEILITKEAIMTNDGPSEKTVTEEIWLTKQDVDEAMHELNFNQAGFVDPHAGLSTMWEVELLPNMLML